MSSDTRLWHPFANMHAVRGAELVIERGAGVHVWDADGNKYLDGRPACGASTSVMADTEIVEAVATQMRRLASYQCFGAFRQRTALALAERLASLAPSTGPACSWARAAATPSTRPPSWPAATSRRSARPSACTSSRARRATTAPTASAPRSAGSRPTARTSDRWTPTPPWCSTTPSTRCATRSRASVPTASPRCSSSRSSGPAALHQPRRATSRASPGCARRPACCSSSTPSSARSGGWAPGSPPSASACART